MDRPKARNVLAACGCVVNLTRLSLGLSRSKPRSKNFSSNSNAIPPIARRPLRPILWTLPSRSASLRVGGVPVARPDIVGITASACPPVASTRSSLTSPRFAPIATRLCPSILAPMIPSRVGIRSPNSLSKPQSSPSIKLTGGPALAVAWPIRPPSPPRSVPMPSGRDWRRT